MSGSRTAPEGLIEPRRSQSTWFCYECTSTFRVPSRNAGNDLPLCPACRSDVVEERNPEDDNGSAFISDYTAARERESSNPGQDEVNSEEAAILQGMFGPPRMYGNRGDGVNPSGSGQSGSRAGGNGQNRQSGGGRAGAETGFEGFGGAAGGLMGLMGDFFNPHGQAGNQTPSAGNSAGASRVRTFQFGNPGSGFAGGGATISFGGSSTLRRGPDGRVVDSRDPFAVPFPAGRALGRPVGGGNGDDRNTNARSNNGWITRGVPDDDGNPEWEDENPFGAGGMPAPWVFGGPGGQGGGDAGQNRRPDGAQAQPEMEELIQGLLGYMNGGHMGGAFPFAMGGGDGFRGNMGDYVFSQEGLDAVMERMMEAAGSSNAPPPASETVIQGLPRVKMDEQGIEANPECTICQDTLSVGDEVVRIPCKHVFHEDCVVPWLQTNGTCPVCRFSLVPEGEREHARQARNEDQHVPNIPANPLQTVFQGIQNLFAGGTEAGPGPSTQRAAGTGSTSTQTVPSGSRMPGSFPQADVDLTEETRDPRRPPELPSRQQSGSVAQTNNGVDNGSRSTESSSSRDRSERPTLLNRDSASPSIQSGGLSTPGFLGLRTPTSTTPGGSSSNPLSSFGQPQLATSQAPGSSSSRRPPPPPPPPRTRPTAPEPYPSAIPAEYRARQARKEAERRANEEASRRSDREDLGSRPSSSRSYDWQSENQDVD